jgi:hypothetical protein
MRGSRGNRRNVRRVGSGSNVRQHGISRRRFLGTAAAGVAGAMIGGAGMAGAYVPLDQPQPDCEGTYQAEDGITHLPIDVPARGYLCQGECIPFSEAYHEPSVDYIGDFYLDEFDDAGIRNLYNELPPPPYPGPTPLPFPNKFAIQGIAFGILYTSYHNTSANNLSDVRRPSDYPDEDFRTLDEITSRIEFTVPGFTGGIVPGGYRDQGPVKLRGWYIHGHGIYNDWTNKVHHPLVVLWTGNSGEITQLNRTSSENFRKLLMHFAIRGFDVLSLDMRAHGVSGGVSMVSSSETNTGAEDIFGILDQLVSGDGLRIITSDGQDLTGANAAEAIDLPVDDSRDIEVLVGGHSRGSNLAAQAMKKNFAESRGYNLKGGLLLGSAEGAYGYMAPSWSILPPPLPPLLTRNGVLVLIEGCLRAHFGIEANIFTDDIQQSERKERIGSL